MSRISIAKVNDACLSDTKYEIWKDGVFYTGNITKKSKNNYVLKFKELGYEIGYHKIVDPNA